MQLYEITYKNIFEKISEAESIMKYSLFLPTTPILERPRLNSPQKTTEWINSTTTAMFENLSIPVTIPSFLRREPNEDDSKEKNHNLAFLDTKGWKFILKQHCILSAYDKTRRILACEHPRTAHTFTKPMYYSFVSKELSSVSNSNKKHLINEKGNFTALPSTERYGLYYLLKHGATKFDEKSNKNPFKAHTDKVAISNGLNSSSVGMKYRIATLSDVLCHSSLNTSPLTIHHNKFDNADSLYQLNTLEFTQFISGRTLKFEGSKIKISSQKIMSMLSSDHLTQAKYSEFEQNYRQIIQGLLFNIENTDKGSHLELADKIYCRYLIEQVYSLSTVDCMYRNIVNSPKCDFLQQRLGTLSLIFRLPNVFGREYILRMAVDTLDYWLREDDDTAKALSRNIRSLNISDVYTEEQKDIILLERYATMIDLLCKYYFPIYENYFFLTLWNSIKAKGDCDDTECAENLFKLLSLYLNNPSNVEYLFNIEKQREPSGAYTYVEEKLDFNSSNPPFAFVNELVKEPKDLALYHRCIKASIGGVDTANTAHAKSDKAKPWHIETPDFLNLGWLNSLDKNLPKDIRDCYIDKIKKARTSTEPKFNNMIDDKLLSSLTEALTARDAYANQLAKLTLKIEKLEQVQSSEKDTE